MSRLRRLGNFGLKPHVFNRRNPVHRRRQYRLCCAVHPSLAAHQFVFRDASSGPVPKPRLIVIFLVARPFLTQCDPAVVLTCLHVYRSPVGFVILNPSVLSVCVAFTPRRHRSICAIIRSEYRNFVARPAIVVWFEHGSSTRTHVYTYCFRPSVRRRSNPFSRSLPFMVYCSACHPYDFATRIQCLTRPHIFPSAHAGLFWVRYDAPRHRRPPDASTRCRRQ